MVNNAFERDRIKDPLIYLTRGPLAATPRDGTWVSVRGRAQPRTVAEVQTRLQGGPVCRTSEADTDRWEVYLRRKIDLFSKTSVYHTLFIWEEKTDAECIVLNT